MSKSNKSFTRWTEKEDNIVKHHMIQNADNNVTLISLFKELEKKINRTHGSISFRWNSKLKHECDHKPLKNTDDFDNVLSSIEQLKEDNERYQKLKEEFDSLSIKYNDVVHKFENISKIIS